MPASKEELARVIATIRDKSKYTEIEQGYFTQSPKIQGYLYKVPSSDKLDKYKIYVLVNTNTDFIYTNRKTVIKDYTVLVYNAKDFEDYASNATIVATELIKVIEEIIARVEEERDSDLPFGYKRDDEGNIRIVPEEADLVRKIFQGYIEIGSMNKLATELKTNFSRVHDVLNDNRYKNIIPKIVSQSDIKQVDQIMAENQKNKVTKADKSRIADLRKKMKQKIRK